MPLFFRCLGYKNINRWTYLLPNCTVLGYILKLYFLHTKKFTSHKDKVSFGEALKDVKMCILSIFLELLCISIIFFWAKIRLLIYKCTTTIRVESFLRFFPLHYVFLPSQNLIIHANRKNEYFPTHDYSCFHCKKNLRSFLMCIAKKETKQSGFMLSALL